MSFNQNSYLISVPSVRDWKPEFGISLINLSMRLAEMGVSFGYNFMINSSLLPASRQRSIQTAIGAGFSHIIMIDDDMAFPPESVVSLIHTLNRDERIHMACANYISKGYGGKPCAQDMENSPLRSSGKTGYQEVSHAGLGLAVLDLSCVKDIPLPWFEVPYLETEHLGEDYYFCRLLRHHGFKVVVDHLASSGVKHIGNYGYSEKDLKDDDNKV